ncbi:MAG: ferrous iron transporter B, partial [Spirochaetota bacterium]
MNGEAPLTVALAGNPNAGKTSLFNALTGAHHKVGNYPGVTVEKREGNIRRGEREYRFVDLPGIYSLTAYSIDEVVARDFLIDERPDLIIDVLDSANLERNLYLCLQFQELGIPVIGALNMSDEAEAKGIRIDAEALSEILGIPFARTVGTRGSGIEPLLDLVDAVAEGRSVSDRRIRYGEEIEARLGPLEAEIDSDPAFVARYPRRWFAAKLLEKDSNALERLEGHLHGKAVAARAREASLWIERHYGKDAEIVISEQRYAYIRGAVREAVAIVKKPDFSLTDSIDRVIMHPLFALPLFAGVLWGVFQLTFSLGEYPMAWLETFFGWLGGIARAGLSEGLLRS